MIPDWDARFEELMRRALSFLEEDDPLSPDLRTVDYGLDSLATVELMIAIEEAYEISIPDEMVQPHTFSTPEVLWGVVNELCHEARKETVGD